MLLTFGFNYIFFFKDFHPFRFMFLQVAKWTGDFFNKGIYDLHVALRGVPLLEWETEAEMDK